MARTRVPWTRPSPEQALGVHGDPYKKIARPGARPGISQAMRPALGGWAAGLLPLPAATVKRTVRVVSSGLLLGLAARPSRARRASSMLAARISGETRYAENHSSYCARAYDVSEPGSVRCARRRAGIGRRRKRGGSASGKDVSRSRGEAGDRSRALPQPARGPGRGATGGIGASVRVPSARGRRLDLRA